MSNAYSPEVNLRRSQTELGRKLYNNGEKEIFVNKGIEPPEGFVLGPLPIYHAKKATTKGKKVYNDGIHNKFFREGELIPPGFVPGTIQRGKFKHSEQTRKRFTEVRTGRKWYTNGIKNIVLAPSDVVPDGFYPGIAKWLCDVRRELSTGVHQSKETIEKRYSTMHKNNTLNSSKREDTLYKKLLETFPEDEIIRYYKDSRYPFVCDFYVKELDLFIELNYHWTHGTGPYYADNLDCQNTIKIWKQKAINSDFYKVAMDVWTVRDVMKLTTLNNNKLNYIILYPKNVYLTGGLGEQWVSQILR